MNLNPIDKPTTTPAPGTAASISLPPLPPVTGECTVGIELGLHARPCGMIVKLTSYFLRPDHGENAAFTCSGFTAPPLSALALGSLCAGPGSKISVEVRGTEPVRAANYLAAVKALLKSKAPDEDLDAPDAAQRLEIPDDVIDALRTEIGDLLAGKKQWT